MKLFDLTVIKLHKSINFLRARRMSRLLAELDDLIHTGTPEQVARKKRIVTELHDMLAEMAGDREGELYCQDRGSIYHTQENASPIRRFTALLKGEKL